MGLEAESELTSAGETVHVKALLESHALILRGAIRKTLPIGEITDPRAVDGQLLFEYHGTPYALRLPDGQADKWLKKLTTQPPSLAAKLGIDAAHKARVRGHTDDAALAAALAGATTEIAAEAALSVVIAATPDDLSAALAALTQDAPQAPVWVIYPKGARSTLPEAAVRNHMHALGFVDTKACAVSDTLTATRFNRRKASHN